MNTPLRLIDQRGSILHFVFWCPGCQTAHGIEDGKRTWNKSMDAPTFTPSYVVRSPPPRCHSFITDGTIRYLDDCEHALKGQTVKLPRINEEWEPEDGP